jgi:hypothetical protein
VTGTERERERESRREGAPVDAGTPHELCVGLCVCYTPRDGVVPRGRARQCEHRGSDVEECSANLGECCVRKCAMERRRAHFAPYVCGSHAALGGSLPPSGSLGDG